MCRDFQTNELTLPRSIQPPHTIVEESGVFISQQSCLTSTCKQGTHQQQIKNNRFSNLFKHDKPEYQILKRSKLQNGCSKNVLNSNMNYLNKNAWMFALLYSFFLQETHAGCSNACDNNYNNLYLTTTSTSTTAATFATADLSVGQLDVPGVAKPPYFPRNKCDNSNWADCFTYTVAITPAACQNFLFWDSGSTQPCTTAKTISTVSSFTINAIPTLPNPVATYACTVTASTSNPNSNIAANFNVFVLACNAATLAWTPNAAFSIAAQTYYVSDSPLTITTSLADQTNACNYAITYSLLKSPATVLTAPEAAVFTIVPGTPNTIQIQTNSCVMAGTYNLVYRAQLTNLRSSFVVVKDASFTVTIYSCCSATAFDPSPFVALVPMSTTALATTAVTQTLQIKDSVSSAYGNLDGWTYCGNRLFTVQTPQTFFSVTSNSLSSTLTLLSTSLSDLTNCASFCPAYTIKIGVCLASFPSQCTTTHPTLTVTIGPCVVTSYTASAYSNKIYIIGSAALAATNPTFIQVPACAYTPTHSITVDTNTFPGVNLNGGGSMFLIFTDDTANNQLLIVDTIMNDGTNVYNFVHTSTITESGGFTSQQTFTVTLQNPCLSASVQDSGQVIAITGEELQATATPSPALAVTQFKNNVAGTSLDPTTGCGPYTYSLTSYTGSFLVYDLTIPELSVLSVLNTDNSASPYSIGLKGCLTNYPAPQSTCFTKNFSVTINDCIILVYSMTTGQTDLSTAPQSYTIGAAALIVTLPTFTQTPLCGYVETKTCYLNASPTACPTWLTATQTSWTVHCTSPATCPAGTYSLVLQSKLNDAAVSLVTQTFLLTIVDPCPLASGNTITAGTVSPMVTSALKNPGVTQTLTYWTDTASTTAGVTTMCGASSFSLVAGTYSASYLTLSGTTLTLMSTLLSDSGSYTVNITQCLTTAAYNNVCTTKPFSVMIGGCALNSFTAPSIAAKTSTIYTGAILTIVIPAYTQSPDCAYGVTYTSTIKKTASANTDRTNYFPDTTTQFSIDATGVQTTPQLQFIKYVAATPSFSVYTDDLNDGGIYTVYITATVAEPVGFTQALDVNTNLNFQLTMVDPCATSVVNNLVDPTKNVVIPTITTSVKYSGFASPFAYIAATYQFHTYMDTISYNYGQYANLQITQPYTGTEGTNSYVYPYDTTTDNSVSIYCGPRTYVFGGAASPMPAWLTFNSATGTIFVQTADDLMVKLSPGYSLTLKACLTYYPTVCSTALTFSVIIEECQIVTFVQDATQIDLTQSIFDIAVTEPIVGYTQTPLCGWIITYTATITSIGAGYTGTAVATQSIVTGNPAWATFDTTPAAPKWTIRSTDFKDAVVFTVNQKVTLNNKINGGTIGTSLNQDFTITFIDPCESNNFIPQNGIGETFDSSAFTTPLIRTSVKLGTDAGGAGTPATKTFAFHHDATSDRLPVGTADSSNWVCGPRTHLVTIVPPSASGTLASGTNFVSVVDSPTLSTLTQPLISAITSSDFDIGYWKITLTVWLTRYPSIYTTETFYIQIDQCILNLLTEDSASYIRSTISSPTVFKIYAKYIQSETLPTYTQEPLCGYPLSYTLTQTQSWDNATQSYDTTVVTCPFAALDNPSSPTIIKFTSSIWSDDLCTYGPTDLTLCNLANSNPYLLMLTAYVDSLLIAPGITFPTAQNTDEQFYVYPQDPCHQTTLNASPVPSKVYFLGDSALKIAVATSKDTVSLDPVNYLVDGSGYDKCGPRTYVLYTLSMSTPTFATVPYQQDPPMISIQTSNAAMVGAQTLTLVSGLANFTQVSTNTTFVITIYNFKIGKAILFQYYQITKAALVLTWAPFTLSPAPALGTMVIYYTQPDVFNQKYPDLPIIPPPTWLVFDVVTRTLKIFTNSFSDQGVYDIVIYGSIAGYSYRKNQTITVNITKTPPPQLSTTPPNFTLPLVNYEFKMGEALSWTLPPTYSVGSFAVKATVTQGPKYLTFDAKTLTFTVKQGGTKKGEAGEVTVQITLQDTAGGKGTYSFKLNCIAPPVVAPVVFNTTAKVAYPVPKITKITNKGTVTVVWDSQMRIPRNLTQLATGACNYVNPITYEIERQLNLQVDVMRGNGNENKNLTFTWNFTSWDTKSMIIQLYFAVPEDVSYGTDLEKLRLTFYGMTQFVSQSGIPVNGGRDPNKNSIPVYKIPAQIAINQAPVVRRNNKAGMSTGQIGPMMVQLGVSSLLNSVWGMVDTQQIIILLPLFKIVLPENAAAFFAQLMTIAAFAIIPTDPIFGFMFAAPPANLPLPLSDNFMAVGFATTYITNNMGTLFFSLMYFPIMSCVYLLIKRIPSNWIMKFRIGLGRSLFWSRTFQTFSDQYTIIATCSLIQLAYLDWNTNYGTIFCSFLGCLYTGTCLALPFVVSYICWKNYDLIKSSDKEFKQKFYSMWKGLSTEDRGFVVYHWYFLLRRFMVGVLCIFSRSTLFYQVAGLVFNIIFGAIIAGNTQCMEDKRLNTIEYFNETMIMMVMYCLICFTDFVPDKDTKSLIGVVCQVFVIFHIVFNLSFLFGDYILNLKLRYKRWAMFRKYAKMRAIKNYKLQKKLRHQRFAQHIKKNEDIQAAIQKKMLQPIQEESKEGSVDNSQLRSYEYAQNKDEEGSNNSSYLENSQQDLDYGDHFKITKGISRQPAEAPQVIIHRLREFADNATSTDYNQNKKLAQVKPVEFARDMEQQTYKNLVKRIPFDSIYPDIQGIMRESGLDDLEEQTYVDKLKRKVIEAPLEIMKSDPERLLHNKLARMVQHDVTLKSSKVRPQDMLNQDLKLRIIADSDAIHRKLFQKMDPGDAAKLSGTEALKHSRNNPKQRRLIVTDEDTASFKVTQDEQGRLFGRDGKRIIEVPAFKYTQDQIVPKVEERKKVARSDYENHIEEEKLEVNNQYTDAKNYEVDQLIEEFSAEATITPQRQSSIVKQPSGEYYAHQTHLKLFGNTVGMKAKSTIPSPRWDFNEVFGTPNTVVMKVNSTTIPSPRQNWDFNEVNSKKISGTPNNDQSSQLLKRSSKKQTQNDIDELLDAISKE